jgi:hypothetical protein
MRRSEAQRSSDILTGSRVLAVAGVTVALAFLVFSGSAFASVPPSIDSESASHVTSTDATLEAQVNLREAGAGAYYQFQVVASPSEFASEILCPQKLPPATDGCIGTQSANALPIGFVAGNTLQPGVDLPAILDLASAGVTLQPGTTYRYRVLVARRVQTEDTIQWEAPTVDGADQTFTTPTPPAIESESISHLTPTDATLEAQINTEGLETMYEFVLTSHHACESANPPCEPPVYLFPLPSGTLLGSFIDQSVSIDLNSAHVKLAPGGEYSYLVSATNAAGNTSGHPQTFTAPQDGVQPLATATSPPSGAGQPVGSNGGDHAAGAGGSSSSSTPDVKAPGPGKTTKGKSMTRVEKLAMALKLCEKKPKSMRTACEKQAKKKYGPMSSKAKKR